MAQEARPAAEGTVPVEVPAFMSEIVATFSQLARQSPQVSQRSGVSVRLSVANYETLVAAALRRALRCKESVAVPRVSDLEMLAASTQGKVEIETVDEREGNVIDRLMKAAVLNVFKEHLRIERLKDVIGAFDGGLVVHTGDDQPASEVVSALESPDAEPLRSIVRDLVPGTAQAPHRAAALEFLLEGLHLSKRLNKDASGAAATYRAR